MFYGRQLPLCVYPCDDSTPGYIHGLTGGPDLSVSSGLPDSCCSGSAGDSVHREPDWPINSGGADEAEAAAAAAAGWDTGCGRKL